MKIDYKQDCEQVVVDDAHGTLLMRSLPAVHAGNSRPSCVALPNFQLTILPSGRWGRLKLAFQLFWMVLTGRAQL